MSFRGGVQCAIVLALTLSCATTARASQEDVSDTLRWEPLPALPDEHGFAGPFVGVHDGALIVAGGANFPDGVPWHPTADGWNSPKRYHDRVFVLESPDAPWKQAETTLPQSLAYGVSVSTPHGVLCVGGEWRTHERNDAAKRWKSTAHLSDRVFLLTWNPETRTVGVSDSVAIGGESKQLPRLPTPTTAMSGALVGNTVYIVGGDTPDGVTSGVWTLDLGAERLEWRVIDPLPGPPRTHSLAAAQSDGRGDSLFVFSGRSHVDGRFHLFQDAYRYRPADRRWTKLGDVALPGESPGCVMAGTAIAAGAHHVLIFGGAAGDVLVEAEQTLPAQITEARAAGDDAKAAELTRRMHDLYDLHDGFSTDVLAYNTVTDTWSRLGTFPSADRAPTGPHADDPANTRSSGSHVTTTAVRWNGRVVIPSGEIAPGVRTPRVWSARIDRGEARFGAWNWGVLGGYLALLVLIGAGFRRREGTTGDYFLASGRVPWWASGLSIFATTLSAITYLSLPAMAFGGDWSYALLNFAIPVVAIAVVYLYLPFFRRLNVTSAYEYLEARFDVSMRLFGSASFILFQLGRMGIVVLLPALALSAVTGIDVYVCIALMGVLATVYTVMGGIEAVVWTDVMQVLVLIGGAGAALWIMAERVDGGFATLVGESFDSGKLALVHNWHAHDLSWARDGILVIILGGVFTNALPPYTSDQAVIQRYMTVRDERASRAAIWTNAVMVVPATVLFFGLGSALWVFYRHHPELLPPLEKSDQLLPWFIAQQMPPGLAGLVIAGVFAAAMSSLDSSMHSIATAFTTDFRKRFDPDIDEQRLLRFARWLTVLLGVLGTASAIVMAGVDITTLWSLFLKIVGLFLGTLAGVFALGIFTNRCNTLHAWLGALAGVGALYYFQFHNPGHIHGLLNGPIAFGACVGVGVLSSVLLPIPGKAVDGLTIYTLERDEHEFD